MSKFNLATFVLVVLAARAGAALPPAAPPPVAKLTLATCVEIALGQNPQLLATLESEQEARWRYYEQRALFVPTATLTGYRRRQTVPPALGNFVFGSAEVDDRHAELDGTIWTGGRWEAGMHARKAAARAARADSLDARNAITFQVTQAYFDVLLARELVTVAASTLAQVQRQLDQAVKSFDAGTAARFDVVRARTQLANAKPPLIRAQSTEKINRQALINAMGLPEDMEFELAGDFDVRPIAVGKDGAVALAWEGREDLKAALLRVKAADESVKEAAAADHPTVTFHVANDHSLGQRPPFDQFVDINDAQVAYNVPIFDGGVSHEHIRELRAERKRLGYLVQQLKNNIRADVVQALARIDEARAVIQSSDEAVREADEAVEIAEAGYQQGLRTNLEVLDAQLARDTARTNRAQARHDYAVARARLEQVLGRKI